MIIFFLDFLKFNRILMRHSGVNQNKYCALEMVILQMELKT